MKSSDTGRPHYCIVLLTGLGDVVHGLPLVNFIRDAQPGARITWVVEPMPSGILLNHPSIDDIIVYRRSTGLSGIRSLWRDLRSVPDIDVTINLNVYFKSVWPTILSGAPRRTGFDRKRAFELVWLASNDRLAPRPRAHTADMFLEFAGHLGIPVTEPDWRIRFSGSEKDAQSQFIARFGDRPVATIVPATATPKKDWLAERWARVATSLEKDFGFQVVLAGGPGPREQFIAEEIVRQSAASIDVAMGDSVRKLSWVLAASDLVLAPDTGPVHVARAFKVPVIGLYGHTNPWRVGPWRAYSDLWIDRYTDPGTAPDAQNRIPKWDRMQKISVDDVIERIGVAVDKYRVLDAHKARAASAGGHSGESHAK